MRTTVLMPMTKNSKNNNCTLECIELSTCMELSLKLECEKNFFRVVKTTGTGNKQKLSQLGLAS